MLMNLKNRTSSCPHHAVKFKCFLLQKSMPYKISLSMQGSTISYRFSEGELGLIIVNKTNLYPMKLRPIHHALEWGLGMFLISKILNQIQLNSNKVALKIGWYIFSNNFRLRFRFFTSLAQPANNFSRQYK